MTSTASRPFFEVRPSPGKGLGLFATRNIPRGTRILSEEPLIRLPPGSDVKQIWELYNILSPAQKATFDNLAHPDNVGNKAKRKETMDAMARVFPPGGSANPPGLTAIMETAYKTRCTFDTNAVTMGDPSGLGMGVFANFSRINHSCIPNVHHSYNETIDREVVHAITFIAKDEEILRSCMVRNDRVWRRDERKIYLRDKAWAGFSCTCAACVGPDAANSARRRETLIRLNETIDAYDGSDYFSNLPRSAPMQRAGEVNMARCLESLRIIAEEGLYGPVALKVYRRTAHACLQLNNWTDALIYAQAERDAEIALFGPETEHMLDDDEAKFALTWLCKLRHLRNCHNIRYQSADNDIPQYIRDAADKCDFDQYRVDVLFKAYDHDEEVALAGRLRAVHEAEWLEVFEGRYREIELDLGLNDDGWRSING